MVGADNWSVWDREKLKKVLQEEEPDKGAAKFLEILPSLDQEETDWWRKTLQELGWEVFYYFFDGACQRGKADGY